MPEIRNKQSNNQWKYKKKLEKFSLKILKWDKKEENKEGNDLILSKSIKFKIED